MPSTCCPFGLRTGAHRARNAEARFHINNLGTRLCSGRRGDFGFFADRRGAAHEFGTTQDSVGPSSSRRLGEIVYQLRRRALENETAATFDHSRRTRGARRQWLRAGRRVHGFGELALSALPALVVLLEFRSCTALFLNAVCSSRGLGHERYHLDGTLSSFAAIGSFRVLSFHSALLCVANYPIHTFKGSVTSKTRRPQPPTALGWRCQ